ncbi:MAG: hypothetical protein HC769_09480 [Cyanobacteria bacterium CRU_2_1]|nr:hypothetical protein [Cyanobacteria bacterium RU_5_0]NJR59056.1 hypothetical protein [Cyanobacteria bacterium CRU_2_1]
MTTSYPLAKSPVMTVEHDIEIAQFVGLNLDALIQLATFADFLAEMQSPQAWGI